MNQQRLSEIWNKLQTGNRVLGWTLEDQGSRQILIPTTGPRRWEREPPAGVWAKIEGFRADRG